MIDGTMVIDFHGHVGRWDTFGMVAGAGEMVRVMDRAGVDRACVFDIFHPDGSRANDAVRDFIAPWSGRFVPFAYVSPLMPGRLVPELERAVDRMGCRGIKVYPPYVGQPLTHPVWEPVWEFAAARGLVVISHTGEEETCPPRMLAELAPRYPGAAFVAGHSGNTREYRRQAIAAVRDCPNVYLETCSTYRTPGVLEELVAGAGADRVLFGSDMPLMDPRVQIGKIVTADLADEDKRLVLGLNARRLLGL